MAVLFPHDQIQILSYHRLVRDLAGMDSQAFLRCLAKDFFVIPGGPAAEGRTAEHSFGMYLKGRWYTLTARPGSFADADPVASLDVSILQDNLLGPILGIEDPRTDKRIDFVGGLGAEERLVTHVDRGEFAVAFLLHPVKLDQIIAVAEAGRFMPPKSTWVEPKLRSGIFVHLLS